MAAIIALALLGLAGEVAIFLLVIRGLRREAAEDLRRAVGGEKVYKVEDCRFLGHLSGGLTQVRGNGMLALTGRGIHFRMLLPRRYLFIPLEDLRSASVAGSFLGKHGGGKEILRVDFRVPGGGEDACGWSVPSAGWWAEALGSMSEGKEPPSLPRENGFKRALCRRPDVGGERPSGYEG